MQIYALDEQQQVTDALKAKRHKNYFCPSCQQIVRLRKGLQKQAHFFHLSPNLHCSQSGKSLTHLAVQKHIASLIGEESRMETIFPSIQRIADVSWKQKRLIFEVQYSWISQKELEERNRDYSSIGYQVIWILHDKRFNQHLFTAAEKYLVDHPHYFTNINAKGQGMIYDQFSMETRGKRVCRGTKVPVQIQYTESLPTTKGPTSKSLFLSNRINTWPTHCKGDLVWLYLIEGNIQAEGLQKIFSLEGRWKAHTSFSKKKFNGVLLWRSLLKIMQRPFLILLRSWIEKACR